MKHHSSYSVISQFTATKSKPLTDVEYAKEAEMLCPEKQQIFKNNSLAEKTVAKNMNDRAEDEECQLKEKCIHLTLAGPCIIIQFK